MPKKIQVRHCLVSSKNNNKSILIKHSKMPVAHRGGNLLTALFKPIVDAVTALGKNKDLATNIGRTAVDVFKIGKNTRDIVKSIKSKPLSISNDAEEVISKIHKLKAGTQPGDGFAYV